MGPGGGGIIDNIDSVAVAESILSMPGWYARLAYIIWLWWIMKTMPCAVASMH